MKRMCCLLLVSLIFLSSCVNAERDASPESNTVSPAAHNDDVSESISETFSQQTEETETSASETSPTESTGIGAEYIVSDYTLQELPMESIVKIEPDGYHEFQNDSVNIAEPQTKSVQLADMGDEIVYIDAPVYQYTVNNPAGAKSFSIYIDPVDGYADTITVTYNDQILFEQWHDRLSQAIAVFPPWKGAFCWVDDDHILVNLYNNTIIYDTTSQTLCRLHNSEAEAGTKELLISMDLQYTTALIKSLKGDSNSVAYIDYTNGIWVDIDSWDYTHMDIDTFAPYQTSEKELLYYQDNQDDDSVKQSVWRFDLSDHSKELVTTIDQDVQYEDMLNQYILFNSSAEDESNRVMLYDISTQTFIYEGSGSGLGFYEEYFVYQDGSTLYFLNQDNMTGYKIEADRINAPLYLITSLTRQKYFMNRETNENFTIILDD